VPGAVASLAIPLVQACLKAVLRNGYSQRQWLRTVFTLLQQLFVFLQLTLLSNIKKKHMIVNLLKIDKFVRTNKSCWITFA
jgi:hypothetical protein